MTITLGPEAQAQLGQEEVVIITERVDDVVLLLGQMIRMGLAEGLDPPIPRHWQQRELSWGWTAVVWLAYILTEGDPRKVSMERYILGMQKTLSQVTGQAIEALDFRDDRLDHLLNHLSQRQYGCPIELALNERSIEVYALPQETIRCDATTVSSGGAVTEGGLLPFGHSKEDPTRPQIKLMTGTLDPLGLPLATDVVSGERADEGLYIPLIDRITTGLNAPGLLFVGDGKMSALAIRRHLVDQAPLLFVPVALDR
jgi:transposase